MAKRTDIHKVLIIGSGPIIIGQACEFDYSGTQACKALRKLGYEIVLVNSNPATIMTDPETADVTYIEPLNVDRLEQIIAKERPDALLPNLGGQSGLNLCAELAKEGILEKYNVQVIGVQVDAIERGEDRIEFKKSMDALGIDMARSQVAYSVEEGLAIADKLGYPVVLRPAYTMGGAGGGLVYNKEELKTVMARGLQASLVGQVLVEESILGWEELELEVVRDEEGNMITVCFIENIDPLGVHTGDSFCSAPMLTISEEVQKRLQEKSHKVVDSVKVIGGCNVQWAHDPKTDRDIIIEINPRTSRSSALASKATGFPIAYVSALLACGLTLDEIPYWKEGTLDNYKPSGDYVVIKFARWAFEKFKGSQDKLGTQMKAVGEVMSIGKNYKEALQKAIRSLETGRYGLGFAKNFHELTLDQLYVKLAEPSSERQFIMYEAIRKGALEAIAGTKAAAELDALRVKYLGKKGELTAVLKLMGSLSAEERPVMGQMANEVRAAVEKAVEAQSAILEKAALEAKLKAETLDVTIPGKEVALGHKHPMYTVLDEIKQVFLDMGFEIMDGPEIELESYNFTKLNAPESHPSRDWTDTFYLTEDSKILLRTQTSPMQIRAMEEHGVPIRMISPGRVYRKDEVDATHSPMFHQIEGLVVDKGVTMADLKGTLNAVIKAIYGANSVTRFRPHHFPFTEPSCEVDIQCHKCGGKGCPTCKGEGWIEVLGAGMVHPKVLRNCGIDPDEYSGFAFGMGLERFAMGHFKISDLRLIFENDERFLQQF